MRAIINGKLYDTEKAKHIMVVFIPYGDSHTKTLDIYRTGRENIFAVCRPEDIMLSPVQIRELLNGRPDLIDAYMSIFGMPEEA